MNKTSHKKSQFWAQPAGWWEETAPVRLVGEKKPLADGFELPLVSRAVSGTAWLFSGLLLMLMQLKPLQAQIIPPQLNPEPTESPSNYRPASNPQAALPADCPPVAIVERETGSVKVNLLPSSPDRYLAHTNITTDSPWTNISSYQWTNTAPIQAHTNAPWTNHSNYVTPHTNFTPGDIIY